MPDLYCMTSREVPVVMQKKKILGKGMLGCGSKERHFLSEGAQGNRQMAAAA